MAFLVRIDWNNDRDFSDAYEDISADVMSMRFRLGIGEPWQLLADESSAEFVLKNTNGKYNPEGTVAPLGGSVRPHKRIKVDFVDNGSTVPLWNGWIDYVEIPGIPEGPNTGKTKAMIYGTGPKQLLQDAEVLLPAVWKPVRPDQIVKDALLKTQLPPVAGSAWILGVAGFSELGQTTYLADETAFMTLDTATITLDNYAMEEAMSAWDVITEMTEIERGRFYFARDGKATWVNRTNRFSYTNDGTVRTSGTVANAYKPQKWDYRYGYGVVTAVNVSGKQRYQDEAAVVLWELNGGIEVGAGELYVRHFTLRLPEGVTNANVVGPRAQNVVFYSGTAEITVQADGPAAKVFFDNRSGIVPAVLTGMEIVGEPILNQNQTTVRLVSQDNVITYGRRNEISLNLPSLGDLYELERIANGELIIHKDPMGEVTRLQFVAKADGVSNQHLLDWTMGYVLDVQIPEIGHIQPPGFLNYYTIIGEEHEFSRGLHTVTYVLEKWRTNPYYTDYEGGI